jgi:puromycin-sensitive aminopeptidase
MSKDVTRLFTQFHPEHYNLNFKPDREAMTFSGTVTVRGKKVGRPSKRLTFHQNDLKIIKATITSHSKAGDNVLTVERINQHKSFNEVRLHTSEMVYPGAYTVTMEFEGQITRPMNGIYPCYFDDPKTKKQKILIATQFESHHAREAFPCIDEPEAKATFDLTLTTPAGEVVLANTPVAKETTKGKLITTTFETTPKMSTYLLAFVYGELQHIEATTKDGVLVRTFSTPANVGHLQFSLDVAVKCLEFYNDYFNLPFPLPKCDLIALPDFASGAMENWGCITFREACMFVDPKNTSLPVKQYVAMVVAHELAHMWFGNLVTMRWWTDLWLNEGFASWIEYLAVDHLFPEWEMWTQFITDDQQAAMRLDSLDNTHPIEVRVRHPDEIRTIFDAISYSKGSSVIHMLHEFLGPDAFRDGLRHYLKEHQYGNTDTIDLWDALEFVSKRPVKNFMHAWTSQPGFPLLQATINTDNIKITQERFYVAKPQNVSADLWPVPLLTNEKVGLDTLEIAEAVNKKAAAINSKGLTPSFLLNAGRSGFYRVVYDAKHTAQLAKEVDQGKLSPADRLGLLSDSFEASKAGYSSSVETLVLMRAYGNEDNNAVWDVMAGVLGSIRVVMDDEKLRQLLRPFVRQLTKKQLGRLGWVAKPKDSHFDQLLRPTILAMSSLADEPAVVKEALARFTSMKVPEDVAPDLRGIIYSTAARHGDAKTFDKLLNMHNNSISSEERTTLAAALTGFKQPELIKRALNVIDTDDVRLQDVAYWVAYSFSNRYAKDTTWDWMTTNWDWLNANLGTDLSFSRFPLYAARSFSDPSFVKKYQEFFEPRLTTTLDRAYRQGLETLTWQAAWKERDLMDIKKFFTDQSQKPQS